ncbi:MAG: hypothetical protein V3R93_07425 [Candidatus Hydrothermarchaeaceae archaeon]
MRIIILALLVIGAACMGGSDNSSEGRSPPQNKSVIIFDAIEKTGIGVENVYTSNGSEIKKAFGLGDSHIEDDSLIAFIIFKYSTPEGIDKKLVLVLNTIYTTLSAEPSIDGVLVMPHDPSIWTGKVSLIYTNRSYAEEVAAQNLPLIKFYNSFDIYMITD